MNEAPDRQCRGTKKSKKEKSRRGRQWCGVTQGPLPSFPRGLASLFVFLPYRPPLWDSKSQREKWVFLVFTQFVTRYCYVLPFSQTLNVCIPKECFKWMELMATRILCGCCNNSGVFQITLLTKEQANPCVHVSMDKKLQWRNLCIFSLLPCGWYARRSQGWWWRHELDSPKLGRKQPPTWHSLSLRTLHYHRMTVPTQVSR